MRPVQVDSSRNHPVLIRFLFLLAGIIGLGTSLLFTLLPDTLLRASYLMELRWAILLTIWSAIVFVFMILLRLTCE